MIDINDIARNLGGTSAVSTKQCCVEFLLDEDEIAKIELDEVVGTTSGAKRLAGFKKNMKKRGRRVCGGRNCSNVYLNACLMTTEGLFRGNFYACFMCRTCATQYGTNTKMVLKHDLPKMLPELIRRTVPLQLLNAVASAAPSLQGEVVKNVARKPAGGSGQTPEAEEGAAEGDESVAAVKKGTKVHAGVAAKPGAVVARSASKRKGAPSTLQPASAVVNQGEDDAGLLQHPARPSGLDLLAGAVVEKGREVKKAKTPMTEKKVASKDDDLEENFATEGEARKHGNIVTFSSVSDGCYYIFRQLGSVHMFDEQNIQNHVGMPSTVDNEIWKSPNKGKFDFSFCFNFRINKKYFHSIS